MRVVVDSNVLISIALKSKALAPIREAWVKGRFTLLGSEPLFAELEAVLRRDKFEQLITPNEVKVFVSSLREVVAWERPQEPYPTFSDPKDSFLLAMVRDAEADLLVTGDGALLELRQFEGRRSFRHEDSLNCWQKLESFDWRIPHTGAFRDQGVFKRL